MQLATALIWSVFGNMKAQKSIHNRSIRRLLFIGPVVCSIAFAGCSDVARTAGTQTNVNLQSTVVGEPQNGDNVSIGPATYNSATHGFERPWPFGPEYNPQ